MYTLVFAYLSLDSAKFLVHFVSLYTSAAATCQSLLTNQSIHPSPSVS